MHLKNDVRHNIGRIRFVCQDFQIINGPIKADKSITSKINRYKTWVILFCKNNLRVENKDPRMYA